MKKINIIIMGIGLAGKVYYDHMSTDPDFNILGVVAPLTKKNFSIALRLRLPIYETLVDAVHMNDHVDAVIIATPNQFHYQHLKEALGFNLFVILEKPITSSYLEAKTMMRECSSSLNKILVAHHRTFNPIITKSKEIINSGQLGEIKTIFGSALFYKPDRYFQENKWRCESGGGPLYINMIHEINTIRLLLGDFDFVFAISSNATRRFEVEDTSSILFRLKSGVLGSFILSDTVVSPHSWEMTSSENISFPYFDNFDCSVISGTKGSLTIPSLKIISYTKEDQERSWWNRPDTTKINIINIDPFLLLLDNFKKMIYINDPPKVTLNDGYMNLKVLNSINESISSFAPVYI